MKEFLAGVARFWFWFAIAGCVLVSSFATAEDPAESTEAPVDVAETHEKILFLNFSDDPIDVFWVDPEDQSRTRIVVAPYESHAQETFSGHTFVYEWKGADTFVHIRSESDMALDLKAIEAGNKVDTTEISPQVHILGGMDQPETRKVVCGTTKGDIHINVKPFWSPQGAARFLYLASEGIRYFDGCALNRVVPRFLTQFGIGAEYGQRLWAREPAQEILDDPQLDPPIHFRPGTMSYAGSGKHSRSTEMFIVMPNTSLEQLNYFGKENSWETPFAYVEPADLEVVGSWHAYGDMPPVSDVAEKNYDAVENTKNLTMNFLDVCFDDFASSGERDLTLKESMRKMDTNISIRISRRWNTS